MNLEKNEISDKLNMIYEKYGTIIEEENAISYFKKIDSSIKSMLVVDYKLELVDLLLLGKMRCGIKFSIKPSKDAVCDYDVYKSNYDRFFVVDLGTNKERIIYQEIKDKRQNRYVIADDLYVKYKGIIENNMEYPWII